MRSTADAPARRKKFEKRNSSDRVGHFGTAFIESGSRVARKIRRDRGRFVLEFGAWIDRRSYESGECGRRNLGRSNTNRRRRHLLLLRIQRLYRCRDRRSFREGW